MEQALARFDQADQSLSVLHDPNLGPQNRGVMIVAKDDLLAQDPDLAPLVSVPEIPEAQLQERLDADETLLEYYLAGSQWMTFVVTRKQVTVTLLGATDIGTEVRDLRQALSNPTGLDASLKSAALYRDTLEPVVDRLKTRHLTIIPHGSLHYVPFCALGPRNDAQMLDRYCIRILPSATVLTFLKDKKTVLNSLILGNPELGNPALDLPYAEEEARTLARILPVPTLRLRKEATAEQIGTGTSYGIIHLAAHGYFDEDHPLDSAILLASTPRTNGTLKVADLYRLNLEADLITLSACETALSKVSSGDDLVGFTRGLLYAGCRSILSSLWKVDDESTRDLMVDFYTQLPILGKAEALRHAQLAVRQKHPQPYYWAAFMVTGNAR
jgi:CHAT domain-containing protein